MHAPIYSHFCRDCLRPCRNIHYPFEVDNLAVLPISTFENWWTKQIGFKARNKAKQAEKKGVTVREAPFDESLVKGIWEIYNESPVRQGAAFSALREEPGSGAQNERDVSRFQRIHRSV